MWCSKWIKQLGITGALFLCILSPGMADDPQGHPIHGYNPNGVQLQRQKVPVFTSSVGPARCKATTDGNLLIDFEGDNILDDCSSSNVISDQYASCGITFVNAACNDQSLPGPNSGGCWSAVANSPSPYKSLIFLGTSLNAARMNVPNGFVNGFSFYYCAAYRPGSVKVYSGENGTGTILAQIDLAITPPTGLNGDKTYDNWQAVGVSFSGVAKSVDFGGTRNYIAFDNITIGNAHAAATEVANFVFDPISNQTVNIPFPVTVKAVDGNGLRVTSFNGTASLTLLPRGGLNYRTLSFVSGIAAPTVSCSTATLGSGDVASVGSGLQMRATSGFITGSSNLFQVVDPSLHATGEVVVSVVVPSGRSGTLTADCDPLTPQSQQTGWSVAGPATMVARFKNLATGTHNFSATLNTSQGVTFNSEKLTLNLLPGQCLTSQVLHISRGRPVILIPGIMGSTVSWGNAVLNGATLLDSVLPYLPWPSPVDRGELQTFEDLRGKTGFSQLKQSLDPYFDVRTAPWDWRVPFSLAVDIYLKPVIDEIKQGSIYNKVDIVAHSMGGLVARRYLQKQWAARKDVDRFIMLGTPNAGSANPYWMVFGGDPEKIDHITDPSKLGIDIYQDVTESEMRDHPDYWWTLKGLGTWAVPNKIIADFYKLYIPTIQELLAGGIIGNNDWKLLSKNSVPFDVVTNDSLVSLNRVLQTTGPANCYGKLSSNPPDAVATKLYLSESERTIVQIPVGEPGTNGLYPQGEPQLSSLDDLHAPENNGDGTVPAEQAALPWGSPQIIDIERGKWGPHVSMMKNSALISKVLADLRSGRPDLQVFTQEAPSVPSVAAVASPFGFGMILVGRALPGITDPSGKRCGWTTAGTVEEIPSASAHFGQTSSTFSLLNPSNGLYAMTLTGRELEVVTVRAQFLDATNAIQSPFLRVLMRPGSYRVPFNVDSAATNRVVLAPTVAPVSGLTCQRSVNAKIQLSWAYTGTSQGFRVYSRNLNENTYTLFQTLPPDGRTVELNFSWNGDIKNFIVLATGTDGTESPFIQEVRNAVYLIAIPISDKLSGRAPLTVNLSSQSTGSPTSYTWDFGDGGSSHQAAVSHTFSIPGTYRVSLLVQNGNEYDVKGVNVIALPPVQVNINQAPLGLFVSDVLPLSASVVNASNTAVTWSTSAGSIDPTGRFTAPSTPGTVTVTATSVEDTTKNASITITVHSTDFDANTISNPKLLGLANAWGSASAVDLTKYDFNGDGVIDDADLTKLFQKMGW